MPTILERFYAAGAENEVADLVDGFEELNAQLDEQHRSSPHDRPRVLHGTSTMTPERLRAVWTARSGR